VFCLKNISESEERILIKIQKTNFNLTLDQRPQRSLRCLLAKATWKINEQKLQNSKFLMEKLVIKAHNLYQFSTTILSCLVYRFIDEFAKYCSMLLN